jgi:hypothetical protein
MNESAGTRNANFYSFCQPVRLLHDTIPILPSKTCAVGGLLLRSLMVSFVLWNIGLQERQERVGPSHSTRSDIVGIGGGGRRNGNWVCRVVLSEFRGEVKGGVGAWGEAGAENSFAEPARS